MARRKIRIITQKQEAFRQAFENVKTNVNYLVVYLAWRITDEEKKVRRSKFLYYRLANRY